MKQKKYTKPKQKNELRRIVEYFAGGGAWFWSGYIIIVLLDDVLGLFLANLIGNAVGLTLNFLIQRYVAFNDNKNQDITKAGWRYAVYTLVNAFGLNYLILLSLKNVGIEPEIGQFIASGFFTLWNYYWYKHWVFAQNDLPVVPAKQQSRSRRTTSRHAAVSRTPVLIRRIENTPHSALHSFLASHSSKSSSVSKENKSGR